MSKAVAWSSVRPEVQMQAGSGWVGEQGSSLEQRKARGTDAGRVWMGW